MTNMGELAILLLTEHPLQDLVVPREKSHYVPRWKRNMQEKSEFASQVFFLSNLEHKLLYGVFCLYSVGP